MKKQRKVITERRRRTHRYVAATVGMLVLCIVSCIALIFYSSIIQAITQKQARSILKDAAASNARMLKYEISNKMTLFQRIANQYRGGQSEEEWEELLERLKPLLELYDFKDLGIATSEGEASSARGGNYDVSEQEFFQRSMLGEVGITSTMEDKNDESRINIYSAPISISGKIQGVFYAVYSTEKFVSLFSSPFEGNSYSYVVNTSGEVMISDNGKYGNLPEVVGASGSINQEAVHQMSEDFKKGQAGSVTYEIDEKKYAYYCPLGINDWFVVTIVPASVVMAQYRPIINYTRHFCFFMGVLCAVAAGYFLGLQRKQKRRLEYYAYVDPVTGGKNNIRFILDTVEILTKTHGKTAAVLAVDINHFKMINQLLGIQAGNRAICGLEQVLQKNCRNSQELVGHSVADRFFILWLYQSEEELKERLEHLCRDLEKLSDSLDNIHFHSAIGVYKVPGTNTTRTDEAYVEQLCGNALMAGQALKGGHTTAYRFWDAELRNRQLQNKIFEDAMYPALERNEFIPWFQPKVDLQTGEICGAESLVRWQKSNGTLISPGSFIPFFETNEFIEKVDRAVMNAVCRYLAIWKKQGYRTVPISVNLSRAYLYSETFAHEWKEELENKQLHVTDLQFEITETVAAKDKERMKKAIDALHAEGFKVLLDDFGTGYSSLFALQELEFDILKLDCRFAWGIGQERTEKILEHVIAMAKSLKMETIAEGVETEAQYCYLKALGVDSIQGFYFYRPMPAEEFEKLLGKISKGF